MVVRGILAQKSGQLALRVSEEGATVRVDGSIVGTSPVPELSLSGGMHTVRIEKEGFIAFTRDVEVPEKATAEMDALLLPSEEYKRQYVESAERTRLIAYVLVGAGVIGFGGAAVLRYTSMEKTAELRGDIQTYNGQTSRSEHDAGALDDRKKQIGQLDAATIGAAAFGLAAAGVGLALWITGDDPSRFEATTSVSVALAPELGGWRVGFAFDY